MNKLTTIKDGICNSFEIVNNLEGKNSNNIIQLIWNGELNYRVKNLNPHQKDDRINSPIVKQKTKDFSAIWLNDILLVKNGNLVYTKKWWQFWQ